MCRERQLAYQIHLVESQAGLSAWRPRPSAQPLTAPVLQSRGGAPLAVHIPLPSTGVEPADEAICYMGSVAVACRQSACWDLAVSTQPAATSLVAPAAQLQLRLATPPPALEQPAKRSRTCSGSSRMEPCMAAPAFHAASWQQHWPLAMAAMAGPQPAAAYYPQQPYAQARVWAPLAVYVPLGPPANACSGGMPQFGGCSFVPPAATAVPQGASHNAGTLSCWLDKIRTLLSPASRMGTAIPTF
jgi:hypothetical protein